MPSEKHIIPLDRRHVCGRLIYFNVIQNCQESHSNAVIEQLSSNTNIEDLSVDPLPFEHLQRNFFLRVVNEAKKQDDNLENNFLNRLATRFHRDIDDLFEDFPEISQKLKSLFKEELNQINCSNCISTLQNKYRAENLGEKGCYLNSIRYMMEVAYEAAKNYYSKFSKIKDIKFPQVILNTEKVISLQSLHNLSISYAIGGKTDFCSLGEECWSAITLCVNLENFDLPTYFALPYFFFHECFAHIFHGILPNSQKRKISEPYDSFTEGWMDFIAFKIFEEVQQKKSRANHPPINFTDLHYNHGFKYHFARFDVSNNSGYTRLIYQGWRAADRLLNLLENIPSSKEKAWEIFLQISFDLNMQQEFTENKRMTFVSIIDRLSSRGADYTPWHAEIGRFIEKYLKDGDLKIFVEHIVSLKSKNINHFS